MKFVMMEKALKTSSIEATFVHKGGNQESWEALRTIFSIVK